ncbi:MAG: hypothetical protein R3209_09405 [Salinimicrobium sediminis]|nr:hypothetical protein [Salinimicrobium sediminis]
MKLLLNSFVAFLLLISVQTCNNTSETPNTNTTEVNSERMEITGTIEQQGMTSYQYGTHTITTADDEYYALKSEAIELDNYLNEEVTIVAEKIEGYPLSGGPDYLLVLEVK